MPVVSALTVGGRFPNRRGKEKEEEKEDGAITVPFSRLLLAPTFAYFHPLPLLSLVPRSQPIQQLAEERGIENGREEE